MEIKARMPSRVLSINVNIGDPVKKGDRLLMLEAMKMETPIPSPCDGTVMEIKTAVGTRINAGNLLMVIE